MVGYAPLRQGSDWVLTTGKEEGVRTSLTTTDVRSSKVLTGVTKGDGLDIADRKEDEGDGGLGQHVEGEKRKRGTCSLE